MLFLLFLCSVLCYQHVFSADQQLELISQRHSSQEAREHYEQAILWHKQGKIETAVYCFKQAAKDRRYLFDIAVYFSYYKSLGRNDWGIDEAIVMQVKRFFNSSINARRAARAYPDFWIKIKPWLKQNESQKNESVIRVNAVQKGKEAQEEPIVLSKPSESPVKKTAEDWYRQGMIFQAMGEMSNAAKCLINTMTMSPSTYVLRAGVPLAYYFCQNKDGGVITYYQMRWIKIRLQKPDYAERAAKQFPDYWPAIKDFFDVYDKNRSFKRAKDEGTSVEFEEDAERLKRKRMRQDQDEGTQVEFEEDEEGLNRKRTRSDDA